MRLYLVLLLQAAVAAHEAPRYWPKFGGTREVTTLDGEWDYGYIDGGDGSSSKFDATSKFHPKDISTPKKMAVPSCMDVVAGGASGYLGPRGTAFYRTSFETPSKSRSVRLQFQSCSFYCRVFVNGEEVTPVTTEINPRSRRDHRPSLNPRLGTTVLVAMLPSGSMSPPSCSRMPRTSCSFSLTTDSIRRPLRCTLGETFGTMVV